MVCIKHVVIYVFYVNRHHLFIFETLSDANKQHLCIVFLLNENKADQRNFDILQSTQYIHQDKSPIYRQSCQTASSHEVLKYAKPFACLKSLLFIHLYIYIVYRFNVKERHITQGYILTIFGSSSVKIFPWTWHCAAIVKIPGHHWCCHQIFYSLGFYWVYRAKIGAYSIDVNMKINMALILKSTVWQADHVQVLCSWKACS